MYSRVILSFLLFGSFLNAASVKELFYEGDIVTIEEEKYPENKIYPNGQKLLYTGYNCFERHLKLGFTAVGPYYAELPLKTLETRLKTGSARMVNVGPPTRYVGLPSDPLERELLHEKIKKRVQLACKYKNVIAWSLHPEELLFYNKSQLAMFNYIAKTIRKYDTLKRPIFCYHSNNRNVDWLVTAAKHTEMMCKGAYRTGTVFVRESTLTCLATLPKVKSKNEIQKTAIPALVLSASGLTSDESIRKVRHDVYLSLITGAHGVMIWSLHPRKGYDKRHYNDKINAHVQCLKELHTDQKLSRVLLFGKRKGDLELKELTPSKLDSKAIATYSKTTAGRTRIKELLKRPGFYSKSDWTSSEYSLEGYRYLFIVNSSKESKDFTVSNFPKESKILDVFKGEYIGFEAKLKENITISLPSFGVTCLRLEAK
jgi:hypothetical protein